MSDDSLSATIRRVMMSRMQACFTMGASWSFSCAQTMMCNLAKVISSPRRDARTNRDAGMVTPSAQQFCKTCCTNYNSSLVKAGWGKNFLPLSPTL